jgi:hypothetical protein
MPSVFRIRLLWKIIAIVFLGVIAGYFRVTVVEETRIEHPIRADALEYYMSAYNLAHNGIYSRSMGAFAKPPEQVVPDAFRPPGLPLIIAAFMDLWPRHDEIVRRVQWVNVALGVATVILIFICAVLVLPAWAALTVGLLAASSPHLISMTVYLLTETPAEFFAALPFAIAAFGIPRGRAARVAFFASLGVAVACLSLFRPVFLAFVPIVALAFPRREDKWRALIYGCVGVALVMAPWFIRNAVSLPKGETPSLAAGGILEGAYRGYVFEDNPFTFPYGGQRDPIFDETRRSLTRTLAVVADKIAQDPVGMMQWYFLEKPVFLFQWSNSDGAGDVFIYPAAATPFRNNPVFVAIHDAFFNAHAYILLLAVLGGVAAWIPAATRGVPGHAAIVLRLASLMLIFQYVIYLPFVAHGRYTVPLFPEIFLLAVASVVLAGKIGQSVWQQGLRLAADGSHAPAAATNSKHDVRALI